LENTISTPSTSRFAALSAAMISLIDDYSLVSFETLSGYSLCHPGHKLLLTRAQLGACLSRSNAPPVAVDMSEPSASARSNAYALFLTDVWISTGTYRNSIRDEAARAVIYANANLQRICTHGLKP
ncbi:hypothetical protein GGX14DRAFT_367028, partial [Mycena pura]